MKIWQRFRTHDHAYKVWRRRKRLAAIASSSYLTIAAVMALFVYKEVFAADLIDVFDFSNPGDYTVSSGVEIAASSARMKAQNYTSDADTLALYHFDETTGSTATDSSSHGNHATTSGTANWTNGNLNNAFSFGGQSVFVAPDAPSLTLTQANSIEAWTKFDTPFGAFSHDHRQGVLDKGAYRLYYDHETGKIVYELMNAGATAWEQQAGSSLNGSWGASNLDNVTAMVAYGDSLYVGTGQTTGGNAQVWRLNGGTWTQVGGQGVNSSWASDTYGTVASLTSTGGYLYAGIGLASGDAEVWRFAGGTWEQVGGDSLNSSWGAGYETVPALAAVGNLLYAGLGSDAGDAEVWRFAGGTWSKIGGDSTNGGWDNSFEAISALGSYNNQLYAALGGATGSAEVWSWDGNTWSQIGGDGVSSSWNTDYERVGALTVFNEKLYAGLGDNTGDAELWEFDGSSWVKTGGDGVSSSWAGGQFEHVSSLATYNGRLYAGLGNSTGDGEVWEYTGSAWSKVAGGSLNSSWPGGAIEAIPSLATYRGKLFAGLGTTTSDDAQVWSYGNNGYLQSSVNGQDDAWHHVAATYDGTTMRLYVDGSLDSQTSVSLGLPDTTTDLRIGSVAGAPAAGQSQGTFNGLIDEVRISRVVRGSFTVLPYSTTPQTVSLASPVRESGVWHWDTLVTTEAGVGTIAYRLSDDNGATWKYWDGADWVVSTDVAESNDAATINAQVATFPVTFDGFTWQAILFSNGHEEVALSNVTLESTSDTVEPAMDGSTITALKAFGGSTLDEDEWTNGSSPYFSWDDGSDDSSGVKGYCAYLGTDDTADPVTTKGLLGNSPVVTGGLCQFIVDTAELDLATPGYLATPLTSSGDTYYFIVKAIDNAGNISSDQSQFAFNFDNTPPLNPGFISAPAGYVSSKTVEITWPTSDPGAPDDEHSGLLGLQYRIGEAGTWYGDLHTGTGDINDLLEVDGSYTTQDPPDFANLSDGINTIYFRTWDQAGNVTTEYVTAVIKLNQSGEPSEPRNLAAIPDVNTENSFAFSWDPPLTFIGSANNITYCYSVNVAPSPSTCSFTAPGTTSLAAGPYATQPGANTMYVVARDEANNINYSNYAIIIFTADTTAPGMPLNLDVTDVSIANTSNWRLALAWDPPSDPGSGVASYRIFRSTDNVSFSLIQTVTGTSYIDEGLNQQIYYYKIQACDNANNCGADSAVDSALPEGSFTEPANLVAGPTISNVTTKRATVTWSTDRNSDSKIAIGTSSGNYSPTEISNSTQVTAHQIEIQNLSAGTTYYFVAKWTDQDNNTGQSQEFSFTTQPAPTLKGVAAQNISFSNAQIGFTSENAHKVSVVYGLTESFGNTVTVNTSPAESSYVADLTSLTDGREYFFKLIAYDAEDSPYESSIFSFTTPARPRISNLSFQPIEGEPSSTQRVTWLTNVPTTSQVTYGKVGEVGQDVIDSQLVTEHEIIIRDLEDDSEYFLVAQGRDIGGNLAISDRHMFHTALDTRSPKITDINIETSIRGSGGEARGQIVISWRTDELSTSQVAYTEGSGATVFNSRTAEDTALSLEHIVVISDLPTSTVYSVQPISNDKANNSGEGETQTAIIGRASDSILTIILNILRKIFGF